MNEWGLICTAESVRGILPGRKTNTRRIPNKINAKWQVGDRLWVRETWMPAERFGYDAPDDGRLGVGDDYEIPYPVWYRATDEGTVEQGDWKPSRFMPKWATRIWLEITGLRKELLQEISLEDIYAEGLGIASDLANEYDEQAKRILLYEQWQRLWDSLNAKRGYGWDTNPEVLVVEFKEILTTD